MLLFTVTLVSVSSSSVTKIQECHWNPKLPCMNQSTWNVSHVWKTAITTAFMCPVFYKAFPFSVLEIKLFICFTLSLYMSNNPIRLCLHHTQIWYFLLDRIPIFNSDCWSQNVAASHKHEHSYSMQHYQPAPTAHRSKFGLLISSARSCCC